MKAEPKQPPPPVSSAERIAAGVLVAFVSGSMVFLGLGEILSSRGLAGMVSEVFAAWQALPVVAASGLVTMINSPAIVGGVSVAFRLAIIVASIPLIVGAVSRARGRQRLLRNRTLWWVALGQAALAVCAIPLVVRHQYLLAYGALSWGEGWLLIEDAFYTVGVHSWVLPYFATGILAAAVLWFTRPRRERRVSREESEDTTWVGDDSFAGDFDGDSAGDD